MENILTDMLNKYGLTSSHQRLMILQFLINNRCHPTADKILSELKKDMPTLSKSTVYKTLNAFVEAKMLREISIEGNELRYEINLIDHGHFKCTNCDMVYDFDIENLSYNKLDGFNITDKNIYFKGICKNCLNNIN